MKSAYDEIYATALKRQHEPQRLYVTGQVIDVNGGLI
jgi:hypothetical protein